MREVEYPAGRDAVADQDHAIRVVDEVSRGAEEPPELLRLEDRAGRGANRGCCARRVARELGGDEWRVEHRRHCAGDRERLPTIGRQGEQHRTDGEQSPFLVGDREAEQ